jgi:uncharacterized protein (UPF0332 family)
LRELEKERLKQARESLDETQALLAAEMNEGRVPSTMQSVTIGLFEQRYIKTGIFKKEYGDAVRRIFSSKPKCSGEKTQVSAEEIHELATRAGAFLHDVETYRKKKSDV